MREIKFRVFNLKHKEMFDALKINLSGEYVIYLDGAPRKREYPEEVILMQYTGLRDKNGKEIYEGDILEIKEKDEPYWTGEAYWGEYGWRGRDFDMAHYDNPCDLFSEGLKYVEVIGNIHENPELVDK